MNDKLLLAISPIVVDRFGEFNLRNDRSVYI